MVWSTEFRLGQALGVLVRSNMHMIVTGNDGIPEVCPVGLYKIRETSFELGMNTRSLPSFQRRR